MMSLSFTQKTGLALTGFALAANVPFTLLIDRFGYDDILREPPLEVMAAFRAGGPELILIWLAFALCALSFVWVSAWVGQAVREQGGRWPAWAAAAGAASAVAQAAGLARWVFVIPGLAQQAEVPDPALQAAAVVGYGVIHQFAGVAIGEWLGQTLLAGWTLALGLELFRGLAGRGIWHRVLGVAGLALAPLWLVGQTELLATVDTAFHALPITAYVYMGWEAWLLLVGLTWAFTRTRQRPST